MEIFGLSHNIDPSVKLSAQWTNMGGSGVVKTQIVVNLWRQYLGNKGSYWKTVKGLPPLINYAESKYALEKWKGRLLSYLGNEGSYRKTVKGELLLIYHAKS